MDSRPQDPPRVLQAARRYWTDLASRAGPLAATVELLAALLGFLRDSTPSRLRQRYGDADYDWDYRVNTTSAAVSWRDRLLGVFHSPYQPTEPALFREMLETLRRSGNLDWTDFVFVDLGSGKGRALLMASDYPFHRIIGVEILPALHKIAQENLARYSSSSQECFAIEPVCMDATRFQYPDDPLVIYLFNPFPESGLRRALENLSQDLAKNPRSVYVLYHNPELEHVLVESIVVEKIAATHQFAIFRIGRCPQQRTDSATR